MTTSSTSPICPECQTALPKDSPQALCPACLMRQALASRTLAGETSAPFEPPHPEELAERFPQFEITECLGHGGMGVVYKARQKSLERWVAIKILPPERGGEEKFSERFAREAQTLAKLNHPNIVTVFDYGESDGLYYIVMEFIDGVNLRDLLRDGKLESKQALAIVPPICEALQYAHDKGIVHRDIKPENLLLDREGRIKIADFGIASLVGSRSEQTGTPAYMAPEQADGEGDHRADIYALGVVLYEMLTGERPTKDLVVPSERSGVDVRLDEMVQRALDEQPDQRYQSADELRTIAQTMQTASAVMPPPPLPVEKKRGMFRRFWWVGLLSTLLALFIIVSGILYFWMSPAKYEASAIVQAVVEDVDISQNYLETHMEILQSRSLLTHVASDLDLPMRWNMREDEAVAALKSMITVNLVRGTDLMEIKIRSTHSEEPVEIASALIDRFQKEFPGHVTIHEKAQQPSSSGGQILVFVSIGIILIGLVLATILPSSSSIRFSLRRRPSKHPAEWNASSSRF